MEKYKLDWTGNFINYLILLYVFIKAIQRGTLDIFDISLSLIGIIASVLIFINNHFKDNE